MYGYPYTPQDVLVGHGKLIPSIHAGMTRSDRVSMFIDIE